MKRMTLHLGGSSPEQVIENYSIACEKARELFEAIRRLSPQPRDYLGPKGNDAYEEDRIRFAALTAAAESLRHWLSEEQLAIVEKAESGGFLS